MNCSSCGALIPQGVAYCPSCGIPTPYSASGQSYGVPPGSPNPTAYGTPSDPYSASPPQPQDPYSALSNPYGGGNSSLPPQGQYGAPFPPNSYPNVASTPPVYAQSAQPGTYTTVTPQKGRSNIGLIIGMIVLVLVLACGGLIYAVTALGRSGLSTLGTVTTTAQATINYNTNGPSGQPIVPSAATIISNAQMTSSIDDNYAPTHLTRTFTVGQTIYVTFDIDSQGQTGCVEAKWYSDQDELASRKFSHDPKNNVGYFTQTYDSSVSGVVELYWSSDTSCGNLQLARVLTFTVTA